MYSIYVLFAHLLLVALVVALSPSFYNYWLEGLFPDVINESWYSPNNTSILNLSTLRSSWWTSSSKLAYLTQSEHLAPSVPPSWHRRMDLSSLVLAFLFRFLSFLYCLLYSSLASSFCAKIHSFEIKYPTPRQQGPIQPWNYKYIMWLIVFTLTSQVSSRELLPWVQ